MAEIKYLDLTGLQRYDQKIKEVVNTGLDSKIGKDDVMLSVMMGPETIQATATGNKTHVIIPANNYWEVKFTNFPYTVELYEYVDGTPTESICPVLDYGDGKLTNDNGKVVASHFALDEYQIDTNKEYALVFNYGNGEHADFTITLGIEHEEVINVQQSLSYLNDTKADKTEVESSLALKADKAEVESSLTLKADKTEVESSLTLKADKTSTENAISNLEDTKIGKDDEMLIVSFEPTTNTTTYSGPNYFYTSLFKGNNWTVECTLNHDNDLINFILLDQDEVFNKELGSVSKKLILTNDNGTLTINKNGQISTIAIDPSKSYKLYTLDISLYPTSHVDVTITQGGDAILNTQKSLSYLNENKADKSDVEGLDIGVKSLKIGATTLKDNVELAYDRVYDHWMQNGLDDGDVYFKIVQRNTNEGASNELIDIVAGKVVGFDNKANTVDIPTAVSQLTNDAGYAVADDLKIAEVTEGLGENVAKAYKFEGGAESAVIEIPKDQTLKSVELGKIVDDAFVVDPTGEILRFTYIIADGSEKVVDVNVSNLITEAELDPVYNLIDTKLDAADVLTVSNEEIDAMFA